MTMDEIDRLLDPAPLPVEAGYERLPGGALHVACRTDLHRCTGEMFEWWFRFRPDTQKYIWWHPVDHVSSNWIVPDSNTHIGSTHLAEEYFTGLPPEKLSIQFRDPHEFFSAPQYERAREEGRVSAAICGRVGFGFEPPKDEAGRVLGGRIIHLGRDTEWGCTLRSHFFLGHDLPALGRDPDEVEQLFPDAFGQALLMHCYNEFTFLSRFLPSLFIAENRASRPVQVPW